MFYNKFINVNLICYFTAVKSIEIRSFLNMLTSLVNYDLYLVHIKIIINKIKLMST